ncbi:N-(5'-phosphoribosyl)anthranilate isomerase [Rathayibacter tritici]|uniref:N-(5'-phosphoribosyl)anthranilate isomerase n=1 Tax=Rathayibacter tritici TaxID=33888 RepID=UPI0011AFEAA7|nr:N-(5'-phosphoribosyl)anthranilate isomerase [Rathayibacter tritici]
MSVVVQVPRLEIKVCGVVDSVELEVLEAGGATIAGVWWAVPGTPRSLGIAALLDLAARSGNFALERCLVTFSSDAKAVAEAARALDARWIQLHAFQNPSLVASVRQVLDASAATAATRIVKVLHLDGDLLLEAPFLRAYDRAGVDAYIIDTVSGVRIGSTGTRADPGALRRVAEKLTRPFLIAGGLDAAVVEDYGELCGEPLWSGVDVDTGARDASGRFDAASIVSISTAWRRLAQTKEHRGVLL